MREWRSGRAACTTAREARVRNGIFRTCLTATDWYSDKAYNREVTVYICVQRERMAAKRGKPGFLTRNLLFGADLELSAGQNAKPG